MSQIENAQQVEVDAGDISGVMGGADFEDPEYGESAIKVNQAVANHLAAKAHLQNQLAYFVGAMIDPMKKILLAIADNISK